MEKVDVAQINVDCMGKNCPTPLVETRKAIRKAQVGDVIEVKGTHPASKKEIPMAVASLGQELLDVREEGGTWWIRIKKVKE
jgi:tRNA 2-thiouridine synthesizing protein A